MRCSSACLLATSRATPGGCESFCSRDRVGLAAVIRRPLGPTPEEACAHPNWSVKGEDLRVDSATMMNKGLEFIEACLLFVTPPSGIEVVIHPESVIHSLVAYEDIQAGPAGPPGYVHSHCRGPVLPERIDASALLDLVAVGSLTFEAPSFERFPPCLGPGGGGAGGLAPAWLNANEVAVAAFLERRIGYLAIPAIIEQVMVGQPLRQRIPRGRVARRSGSAAYKEALLSTYAAKKA